MFASNVVGSKIRNAVDGTIYNERVGTIGEKKFFRVIDVTGYYNSSGSKTFGNKTPNKLFYANYEEYLNNNRHKQMTPNFTLTNSKRITDTCNEDLELELEPEKDEHLVLEN